MKITKGGNCPLCGNYVEKQSVLKKKVKININDTRRLRVALHERGRDPEDINDFLYTVNLAEDRLVMLDIPDYKRIGCKVYDKYAMFNRGKDTWFLEFIDSGKDIKNKQTLVLSEQAKEILGNIILGGN